MHLQQRLYVLRCGRMNAMHTHSQWDVFFFSLFKFIYLFRSRCDLTCARLNGVKCAHCNRWRWNKIWPNSNVSHGNCTKIQFEPFARATQFTHLAKMRREWKKTSKNVEREEKNQQTQQFEMKTLEKHLTINYPITILGEETFRSTKWERCIP